MFLDFGRFLEDFAHCSWIFPKSSHCSCVKSQEIITEYLPLPYGILIDEYRHYSYYCAIEEDEAVVLTGGIHARTKVTKYTKTGQAASLPSLNTGRFAHACGKIIKKDGATVGRGS